MKFYLIKFLFIMSYKIFILFKLLNLVVTVCSMLSQSEASEAITNVSCANISEIMSFRVH